MENKDFKYLLQDITRLFLGKELTYQDIIEMEDAPFKLKAVTNTYFIKDAARETKIKEHINTISPQDFSYQVYLQLKLQIKVNMISHKKDIFGKNKEIHKTITCNLKDYQEKYRECVLMGDAFIEEIQISKLALMAMGS